MHAEPMRSHAHSMSRILVVDDDELGVRVATRTLTRLGLTDYSLAPNGAEGLRIIDEANGSIEIVVCDLNMPEMDGIVFLRHLAERGFKGSVVIISGEDHDVLRAAEGVARAHRLQVLGAIEKPVTVDTLGPMLARASGTVVARARSQFPGPVLDVEDLRRAIEKDELVLYFQPKISVKTGEIHSFEALVRWQHPILGMLSPVTFIPLAEKEGLIDALTHVVAQKALAEAGRWKKHGYDFGIAINVPADSIERLDLPEFIGATAAEMGVDPSRVMVEVTETQVLRDVAKSLETLTRLRLRRIGLSVDDFGTGYSSLEQLQRIPFVELKIDRSFVDGASTSRSSRAILESSVELAKKLGLSTVAEGVETKEDWAVLVELGCDLAQGYYISPPLPIETLFPWIARWNAEHALV